MKKVTIEEFERCEMNVTEANSYGVYPPTLSVVVADKKEVQITLLVARTSEGYCFSYDFSFMEPFEGGGRYPCISDPKFEDRTLGIINCLKECQKVRSMKRGHRYIAEALNRLENRQLTLF